MTLSIKLDNSSLSYFKTSEKLNSIKKEGRFNRIALVQPEIPDGNYLPSLGLLYIAAVLERGGFEVKVFDQGQKPGVLSDILGFGAGLVGITAVTSSINRAFQLAEEIKAVCPETRVVIGGSHATGSPYETIENPFVDFVVKGEGEYPMLHLSRALKQGGELEDISQIGSLFYKVDDVVKKNKEQEDLNNVMLDELPYPAFHLLDLDYAFKSVTHGLFNRGKRVLPLMTARGCPQTCTFCCRLMGFHLRERSVENVMQEIRFLIRTYQVDEIYFEDDDFTNNKPRALQIMRAVRDARLPIFIKFANGLRADNVDEEMMVAIKEAGGYWLGFGIESGSQKVLEIMKKNLDLDVAKKNVALAKSLGFFVGANCIMGYPGETRKDMKQSINFFQKLSLDSCAIVGLVPFPKTALHGFCQQKGYLTQHADSYDNYYFKIFNPKILVLTGEVSEREIQWCIKIFYLRFYCHPKRVLRVVKFAFKKIKNLLVRKELTLNRLLPQLRKAVVE